MRKLYCYVDESGQETKGRIFVVTVIITSANYWQLMAICETYEQTSQKGRRKWHGSNPQARLEFMRLVLADVRFQGVLCYSKLQNETRPDYDAFTINTLVGVIVSKTDDERAVTEVWIDGLSKTKRTEYANILRAKGIRNVHLHRVRTEDTSTLIRLADSLAGFLRDSIDAKYPDVVQMAQHGRSNGIIVEI